MTGTGSDHGIYIAIIGVGVILLAAAIFLIIRHLNRNGGKSGKTCSGQRTADTARPRNSAGRLTSPSLEDIQKAPVVEAAAQLARQLHQGQLERPARTTSRGT